MVNPSEVHLIGEKFAGYFRGHKITRNYRYRGDSHDRHDYWWEGFCRIIERSSGNDVRGVFVSNDVQYTARLEDSLLSFSSSRWSIPPNVEIRERTKVIDGVLEEAYKNGRSQLLDITVFVPRIVMPKLSLDDLEKAAVVELR